MLKLHKDLPKAKTPHVWADGLRLTAYGMRKRWRKCGKCGTLPIFLSDVKARHDKMGGLVETMLKLHGHP